MSISSDSKKSVRVTKPGLAELGARAAPDNSSAVEGRAPRGVRPPDASAPFRRRPSRLCRVAHTRAQRSGPPVSMPWPTLRSVRRVSQPARACVGTLELSNTCVCRRVVSLKLLVVLVARMYPRHGFIRGLLGLGHSRRREPGRRLLSRTRWRAVADIPGHGYATSSLDNTGCDNWLDHCITHANMAVRSSSSAHPRGAVASTRTVAEAWLRGRYPSEAALPRASSLPPRADLASSSPLDPHVDFREARFRCSKWLVPRLTFTGSGRRRR